ncbi:MAG: 30S ribosomal protein S17e [Nanoarchaeota archaeon]|mgnify:CR=1
MGRIKTQQVKRIGHEMFQKEPAGFKTTFNENKEIIGKQATFASKKLRNLVAGYLTRLARQSKQ